MSNIRVRFDAGEVFYHAPTDTVYHRLAGQPTSGGADTKLSGEDELNIEGEEFTRHTNSPYRSSWTACQVGIAQYTDEYNNYILTTEDDIGTYKQIFESPAVGEMRSWASGGSVGLYVNGAYVKMFSSYAKTFGDAAALRLNGGDVVTIGSTFDEGPLTSGDDGKHVHVLFCPDAEVYEEPPPDITAVMLAEAIRERQLHYGIREVFAAADPTNTAKLIDATGSTDYSLEEFKAYVNYLTQGDIFVDPEDNDWFEDLSAVTTLDTAAWADGAASVPELYYLTITLRKTHTEVFSHDGESWKVLTEWTYEHV